MRLRLPGGGISGAVRRVGPDWLLVDEGNGRESVVVTHTCSASGDWAGCRRCPGTQGAVESRLGLRHALRGIARDRSPVRLELAAPGGASADAGPGPLTVDATIDRVGVDFVEVAAHAAGEARRRDEVREVELIPLAVLAAVRRSV